MHVAPACKCQRAAFHVQPCIRYARRIAVDAAWPRICTNGVELESWLAADDAGLKKHFSRAAAAAGGTLRAASVSRKKDAGPDGKQLVQGLRLRGVLLGRRRQGRHDAAAGAATQWITRWIDLVLLPDLCARNSRALQVNSA